MLRFRDTNVGRTWLRCSSIAGVGTFCKLEWPCKVVSMDRMTHAVTHSDTVVANMDSFPKSYNIVGLGLI